ncbi:glycosyltransferase family 4 protein [Kineosporia succinea]|uniref:Glycosyltransferase involved in cell wall biosynthesis n=1 Tax=Kineosporia succinea TaxID=84632 RepID=A0ABT9NYA4_9ACTN|nr:glycosyltransferase family 4 protein [Kineosporia succinea]MDP9825412.1 glycosyltransferase involved in cell wall biosynthesis [Kineosporia succinea]
MTSFLVQSGGPASGPPGRGLRIAIVGPSHPFKGGVAAHTTQTAHALAAAGHEVELVSWSRLYPHSLYPGEQAVPEGGPDLPPYPNTTRPLRWDRPGTWWNTGKHLRDVDLVIVVVVVPIQVPSLLTLVRSIRVASRGRRVGAPKPGIVAIAHNVVPHETHPGGELLIRKMLRSVDGIVVHSAEQAQLAHDLGLDRRPVVTVPLAPHLPGGLPDRAGRQLAAARPARAEGDPLRVLTLGMVREYKGYDLLLEAAKGVPEVSVTVAGEQWGAAGERVRELAADPALAGRVDVRPGYVAGVDIPPLLARHDVLALPYRHATASQNVLLGHAHGLPVLATSVGTFGDDVHDGVDGLLVPPGDVPALVSALKQLAAPGELDRLRAGLPDIDLTGPWDRYVAALTGVTPVESRR